MMDFFLYSGGIRRVHDLKFIEFVAEHRKSDKLTLMLATLGGASDAAYKIGRYLQSEYDSVKVFIPGICKSAGTLLAIAADEIIFSPYGELGPLDVQVTKTNDLGRLESGQNIGEAFLALETRAKDTFNNMVNEITKISGGMISFQTASHSASEILSSLYGPIFARIDPEEVGSRTRAMRIVEEYGKRLNTKYGNLNSDAIYTLSRGYPNHNFVVDMREAKMLFKHVRKATDDEKTIVNHIGSACRIPSSTHPLIENHTELYNQILNGENTNDHKKPKFKGKPEN